MDSVINRPTERATQVGPWLGSALAVSFVLSSAAARADEPSAPPSTPAVVAPTPTVVAPSPAVAAPTPVLAAPTYAVPSWSAPATGQPPPAGYYAPPPIQVASPGPDVIRAKKDDEVAPAGYHVEYRIRKGSVVAGGVIFGLPYGFSVLAGGGMVSEGEPRAAVLFIPVVGPFIMPAIASADTGLLSGLLILDGLMQVAGASTLAVGLLSKRRMFVRDDVAKSFVMPVPMRFGANSAGVGVVGTF